MATSEPPFNISILLPDLRGGGVERMRVRMAEEWISLGIGVEFVLNRATGELMASIPKGAGAISLGATRIRSSFWPLVRYLRERRPGALLVAMWPLTALAPWAALVAGYNGRLVLSEHAPLSIANARRGAVYRTLMRASMRLSYPLAAARVAVSGGVADDMAALSGLPRSQFTVIHNPAASSGAGVVADVQQLPSANRPLLLSVGNLKKVKRHDLLIEAFAHGPAKIGATLCILGEGAERPRLLRQIQSLGLAGQVLLPGFVSNAAPWYATADLFVLASDYEGFGNVLVEALEHGTPIVCTDCPTGPREILADGKYGVLVPRGDVAALSKAMLEALSASHDRGLLRTRARDFSATAAANAYLKLMRPGSTVGGEA